MRVNYIATSSGIAYPAYMSEWTPNASGEVLLTFDDGSRDTVYFREVEPILPDTRETMLDYLNARER